MAKCGKTAEFGIEAKPDTAAETRRFEPVCRAHIAPAIRNYMKPPHGHGTYSRVDAGRIEGFEDVALPAACGYDDQVHGLKS